LENLVFENLETNLNKNHNLHSMYAKNSVHNNETTELPRKIYLSPIVKKIAQMTKKSFPLCQAKVDFYNFLNKRNFV
jgi:hypothetical protein